MTSFETDPFGAREARATGTGNKLPEKSLKIWLRQTKKEIGWAIKIKKKHTKNGAR